MAKKEIEQTEIEAPYELPEGWKWISIGECCEKAFSGKSPKYSKEETPYKIIGQQANQRYGIDLKFVKFGTQEYAEAQADFYYLQYNDVILNTLGTGSIGRSGIYKYHEKILTDGHPFVFRTGTKYSPDLLFYYLRLNEQEIINTANGSTNQKFLSLKTFSKFPFPLPPTLAEQQRIVNRIESMFAKLDEAKEKASNVLDGFELRKAAILHKAFTGKLTAKWRKENDVSDDSWEEKTIGELFTHTTGKALKKDNQIGTLRKYITTSNLYWGRFDFSEVREMYFTDGELEKCTAKKGDLLVCNGGDVGRSAIWDFDYDICLQNHVSKLRKKDNNIETRLFFYYFMLSKIKGNVTAKGIGISSLSQKDLLAMKINLPTLPEQQEIVRILDSVLEKENKAKQAAEAVLEQIDLLKKTILARAFRGEL